MHSPSPTRRSAPTGRQYLPHLVPLSADVSDYKEPMPPARLASFTIVWLALAVFTVDMLRHARTGSRRAGVVTVPAGL